MSNAFAMNEKTALTPPDADRLQRGIQSIEVGGQLLQALVHHGRPMALKDLAREADMSAAKAHPYMVSFGRIGLVAQDDGSGHYRLGALAEVLALSRRAMRLVRQNLGWALGYNALALPAAALGWIGPWEAALGMAASSFVVVLNALRPLTGNKAWKAASPSSSPSRSPSYS